MKGTPNGAREMGFSNDSVDCAYNIIVNIIVNTPVPHGRPHHQRSLTLSGFPATATSVPRRVYSLCDAERETESSEYGEPMTSKRASSSINCQSRRRHIQNSSPCRKWRHTSRISRIFHCAKCISPTRSRRLSAGRRTDLDASALAANVLRRILAAQCARRP